MTDFTASDFHELPDDYVAWLDAERVRNASPFCHGCGELLTDAEHAANTVDYWGRTYCFLCDYPGVRTDVEWHAFCSTVPRFNVAAMGHEQLFAFVEFDPELPARFARAGALRIDSVIAPF